MKRQICKRANYEAELAGRDAFDPARIVAVLHTGAASKVLSLYYYKWLLGNHFLL